MNPFDHRIGLKASTAPLTLLWPHLLGRESFAWYDAMDF